MGRISILLTMAVGFFFVSLTALSFGYLSPDILMPAMNHSVQEIGRSSVAYLAYPFAESVVFLIVSGNLKPGQSKYRAYLLGLLAGGLTVVFASLRNIMMLGEYAYGTLYFSSYTAADLIDIDSYLQLIEAFVSIGMLCCAFASISFCLYDAAEGGPRICAEAVWIDFRRAGARGSSRFPTPFSYDEGSVRLRKRCVLYLCASDTDWGARDSLVAREGEKSKKRACPAHCQESRLRMAKMRSGRLSQVHEALWFHFRNECIFQ